jgi:hypothetical protein
MEGETYTFESRIRQISTGGVQTIQIPFNTVETWHVVFAVHQYIGTENEEVRVN